MKWVALNAFDFFKFIVIIVCHCCSVGINKGN